MRRGACGLLLGWGLLFSAAAAADPAARPSSASDRVSEEVDVWGESEIQRAHQAVVEELRGLGYDRKVIERGDRLILKHRDAWRGQVVLHADGFIVHRRQGVHIQDPAQGSMGAAGWLLCPIQPTACVRAGGLTVSKRRLAQEKRRTARLVEPKTQQLRDRIADASTTRTVEGLPDRLDALWERGEPLQGEAALPDPASRRAHLLDYWASRTDTRWGEEVREAVQDFAIAVIQESAHPFTEAELALAKERSGRAFPLGAPAVDDSSAPGPRGEGSPGGPPQPD